MAFKRTKRNIATLQKSPEHIRSSAASRLIIVVSAAVIIVWLFILLPLQIYLNHFFNQLNSENDFPASLVATPSPE